MLPNIRNKEFSRDLNKINKEYLIELKQIYDKNNNRKSKKTKQETKDEIKSQISFLLWSAIMAYFATSIFYGFAHFKEGIIKIVTSNECIPHMDGVYVNPKDPTKMMASAGVSDSQKYVEHSVCAVFRNSIKTLYNALISGNPVSIVMQLGGTLAFPFFPYALKKSISNAVDILFRCFEDPTYAAKINKAAKKRIEIEDQKLEEDGFSQFKEEEEEAEEEEAEEEEAGEEGEEEESEEGVADEDEVLEKQVAEELLKARSKAKKEEVGIIQFVKEKIEKSFQEAKEDVEDAEKSVKQALKEEEKSMRASKLATERISEQASKRISEQASKRALKEE